MTRFSEMPLSAALQQRLAASNFHVPTPVQSAAIPHALVGKDLVATAQTGTGKTLAFLLPIIERLLRSPKSRSVEALVLVPTRELAMQVHEQFEALRGPSLAPAALVMGGTAEGRQLAAIRSGARVLVATPGRLEDYLGRRLVDLRQVNVLVLDEADRMLDMGFLPAIRRIVSALPDQRQTLCFSATLEASVAGLVSDYTRDPIRIALGSTLKPVDSVELHAFEVASSEKLDALRHLLRTEQGRTLVFARTKRGTERLARHPSRSLCQRILFRLSLGGLEQRRIARLEASHFGSFVAQNFPARAGLAKRAEVLSIVAPTQIRCVDATAAKLVRPHRRIQNSADEERSFHGIRRATRTKEVLNRVRERLEQIPISPRSVEERCRVNLRVSF